MTVYHVGRSFSGTRLEDVCPCPKALCGLVIASADVAATQCDQHSFAAARTIRQGHSAEHCHETQVDDLANLIGDLAYLGKQVPHGHSKAIATLLINKGYAKAPATAPATEPTEGEPDE